MFCDSEYQPKFNGSIHTICSAYLCDSYGHAHLINKRAKPFFFSFRIIFSSFFAIYLFLLVKSLRVLSVSWFVFETSQKCRYWSDFSLVYEYGTVVIYDFVCVYMRLSFSICVWSIHFFHIFSMKEENTKKNTQ